MCVSVCCRERDIKKERERERDGECVFDAISTRYVKSIVFILRQRTEEAAQGDKGREEGRKEGCKKERREGIKRRWNNWNKKERT